MRMAGRFSRRLRAWAEANGVPVVDCGRGERKPLTAEEFLAEHKPGPSLFLVLVGRAPGVVWHVQKTSDGKTGNIARKEPWPYVHHYYFHIMDPDWGHITIRMCGHPPLNAQIALSSSPKGFTASDLARKVCALNGSPATPYTARQAAYDLRKLRGKDLAGKIGNSRRYQPAPKGLRAMAAIAVLRDKVIKPLLAAGCHPSLHPETQDPARIDEHYDNLRSGMRRLFGALGIAA